MKTNQSKENVKEIQVVKENIEILSYFATNEQGIPMFRVLSSDSMLQFKILNKPFGLVGLKSETMTDKKEKLLQACIAGNGVIVSILKRDKFGNVEGRNYLFLSDEALMELCSIAGVDETKYGIQDYMRDMHIANNLMETMTECVTISYSEVPDEQGVSRVITNFSDSNEK